MGSVRRVGSVYTTVPGKFSMHNVTQTCGTRCPARSPIHLFHECLQTWWRARDNVRRRAAKRTRNTGYR